MEVNKKKQIPNNRGKKHSMRKHWVLSFKLIITLHFMILINSLIFLEEATDSPSATKRYRRTNPITLPQRIHQDNIAENQRQPIFITDIGNSEVLDLLFKDGVQPDQDYEYIQYELIQKFNEYVERFGKKNGRMLKHLIDQNSKQRLISKLDDLHEKHKMIVKRFFSHKVNLNDDNLYPTYVKMNEELNSIQIIIMKTIKDIKARNGDLQASCCQLHFEEVSFQALSVTSKSLLSTSPTSLSQLNNT